MSTNRRWDTFFRLRLSAQRRAVRLCPNCCLPLDGTRLGWRCRNLVAAKATPPTAAPAASRTSDPDFRTTEPPTPAGTAAMRFCGLTRRRSTTTCECGSTRPREDVCLACRQPLPLGWLDGGGLSVGMVGLSGAGKTHYVLALYDWWNENLSKFRFAVSSRMDSTREFSFRRMLSLVRRRETAGLTPPSGRPFYTWDLRTSDRAPSFVPHRLLPWMQPLCLMYHDTAGERFNSTEQIAESQAAYVEASDYLVVLIDSAKLRLVADANTGVSNDHERSIGEAISLQSTIEAIRARTGNNDRRIDIPVAVCLNKIDVLTPRLRYLDQFLREHVPHHDGYFDHATVSRVGDEVEHVMETELGLGNVVQLVKANFEHFQFFATATIGSGLPGESPGALATDLTGTSPFELWRPTRVEDPCLWMLWREGRIPGRT